MRRRLRPSFTFGRGWVYTRAVRFELRLRSIRPPDEPNLNPPQPPGTVGPGSALPGDPHGVTLEPGPPAVPPPPRIVAPAAWSGWPADWSTSWGQAQQQRLTASAWACLDLNASVLASMPPYLVNAAPSLDSDWLRNPQPLTYTGWPEFAKQLFWDFQLGEVFVLATADYASGWPSRFHVVPPWLVDVELEAGVRRYRVGGEDVTADLLHIRYQSSVDDARGHGPLEAAGLHLTAADVLARYATNLAAGGGIPPSILTSEERLSADQSADLKAQWVAARTSGIGEPAVLSGGVGWDAVSVNPKDMALVELLAWNESRVAVMLGVPPFLVGLPSASGESMTYKNVSSIFSFHWRSSLLPKATAVCAALSEFLLPRGTLLEVNRDSYVQAEPLERAQTEATLNAIRDDQGNPAMTVAEIRATERLDSSSSDTVASSPLA